MSSMSYAEVLYKRALMYLEAAKTSLERRFYDVAALEAEIATQLAVKALIARLGVEPPRTHYIRRLISVLRRLLPPEHAKRVDEYVKEHRVRLMLLERAREAGQYGGKPVDEEEARVVVETAEELIRFIRGLWEALERESASAKELEERG